MNEHDDNYDVVVIGGGAAGLTAAVALLRSRRSVLLIDAGDPRNAPAGHVHNFLTQDGTPPEDLYAAGRTEVQAYGGQVARAHAGALERHGDLFRVQTGDRTVTARRVLVATGARDQLPDIPGLRTGGASTCCTARTATVGRSAAGALGCSPPGRWAPTRR